MTLIYYIITLLYTFLFSMIFGVDFTEYTSVSTYLLTIVSFVIGLILAFVTVILFLSLFYWVRKKKPYDNKFNHRFINSILQLALHLMRVKLTVTGRENIPTDKNFVMVGNHQENYDVIILKVIFKDKILNFIAKEALSKVPVLGNWIVLLGNIFISRDADRSAAESIVKGIKQVRKGTNMGIFPEGRRSFGNDLIDFKAGAFKLAMKPKADILIVTQYDVCTIFKKVPWKRYDVRVHISPLYTYEEYQGMNSHEISAHVKGIINDQLDKFKAMKK